MVIQIAKVIPYTRADGEKDIDIKYPSETPGKDDMHQPLYIAEILVTLKNHFAGQEHILVSGDSFIYYEQGNPRARFRPDSYVVFGVDVEEMYVDDTYVMWRARKAPDFAMEIGSKSTRRNDLAPKARTVCTAWDTRVLEVRLDRRRLLRRTTGRRIP